MGRPEREGLPFLLKSNRFAAMHIMIIIHPSSPLLPYRLGINMFADGKLRKLQGSAIVKRMPYSASPIYGRAPDFLLKEDPPNKWPAGGPGPGGRRNSSLESILMHE
jgi:hypothetical protein